MDGGADGGGRSLTLPDACEITAAVDTFKRVVTDEAPEVVKDLPALIGALTGAHYALVDKYHPRADGKRWRDLLVEFSGRIQAAQKKGNS